MSLQIKSFCGKSVDKSRSLAISDMLVRFWRDLSLLTTDYQVRTCSQLSGRHLDQRGRKILMRKKQCSRRTNDIHLPLKSGTNVPQDLLVQRPNSFWGDWIDRGLNQIVRCKRTERWSVVDRRGFVIYEYSPDYIRPMYSKCGCGTSVIE